ncbi:MAG: hypothetical protein ACAH81_13530 [Actinomycetota bacterium]
MIRPREVVKARPGPGSGATSPYSVVAVHAGSHGSAHPSSNAATSVGSAPDVKMMRPSTTAGVVGASPR